MNNPERCEQTCTLLLNADPNNEAAAVMMADLAFRKVNKKKYFAKRKLFLI